MVKTITVIAIIQIVVAVAIEVCVLKIYKQVLAAHWEDNDRYSNCCPGILIHKFRSNIPQQNLNPQHHKRIEQDCLLNQQYQQTQSLDYLYNSPSIACLLSPLNMLVHAVLQPNVSRFFFGNFL